MEDENNLNQNSLLKNSNNSLKNNTNVINESQLYKTDFNYTNNSNNINNNNYVFYANNKIKLRSQNDFIFLGDELHLYREIPHLGNFYSYKNKSVKGIFIDKTICMMNPDQYYAKIINFITFINNYI